MPLISIITTVYDAKDYLPRTIRSILAQTLTDFELILVEDGSPNGCGELCDEWAAKDSRIRVIHKPNGGPASASNAGLDAARGQYIGFVDSDDLIAPDMYEKLYRALTEAGCAMAGCNARCINEQDQKVERTVSAALCGRQDALELFRDVFQNGGMYGMLCWNKLIDARLFEGLRFDTTLLYGDDCNILHKIYDGQQIVCLPDELYFYRERAGSLTAAAFRPRMLDDLTVYKMWYDYLLTRPGREDLAQWALARYWQVFYIFYVHARQQGELDEAARAAFDAHLPVLRGLKRAIRACPHIARGEKLRAMLFCQNPELVYRAAKAWGDFTERRKGARHA